MKNHGTILTLDVYSDDEFPSAVREVEINAAQRFGYVDPVPDFETDVKFLACSKWGDVYVVHVADLRTGSTASGRLTQQNVRHGDSFRSLSV